MVAKRKTANRKPAVRIEPVWVDFPERKVKALLMRKTAKMSVVKYLEDVNTAVYEAKKGEERRVANLFVSPRK